MTEPKWVRLIEAFQRANADMVKSYLEANGLEVQLSQEAYFEYRIGAAFGPVEVLVRDDQFEAAKKLYDDTGWNFDTAETDEDEADEKES